MKQQRLTWLLVCLLMVVGIAQVIYVVQGIDRYVVANDSAMDFAANRGAIVQLDDVLTMSARLHAATGDVRWRERYLKNVTALDDLLDETLGPAENEIASASASNVMGAHRRLVATEAKAFALAAEGRFAQGLELLTSSSYERQKAIYRDGLTAALDAGRAHHRHRLDVQRRTVILTVTVLILSLLLVFEVWRRLSMAAQQRVSWQTEETLEWERKCSGLQRQFVSMLAHELRTPLAIIDSKAQRLVRRADLLTADRTSEIGQGIRGSVQRLLDLMDRVLNASRIEEGRIEMAVKTFDLAACIEDVVSGYRELNAGRRIKVSLDDMPEGVEGDPQLLSQVMSNLVSNALKYSKADDLVSVEGYRKDGQLVIAVHDEGIGIPAGEIGKLCQRFFRASNSKGIAGTGIGLHFIKHVIDLHRGRLDIESVHGVGSTFTVRLPLPPPRRDRPMTATSSTPRMEPAVPAH